MTTTKNKIIDPCLYKRSDFGQLIYDSYGDNWVKVEDQSIAYIDEYGREVSVTYDIYIEGVIDKSGDEWGDVEITTEDITVKTVYIDEVEVELTNEIKIEVSKTIENII